MINIAHISDIHFGHKFSESAWAGVVDTVAAFDPHLIVVSGDLVDHPSPAHLLAAKCGLSQLLEEVHTKSNLRWGEGKGRAAELIIVPGNHDVYESGVAFGLKRLDWFERIFHGADTTKAEDALKAKLNTEKLGFDSICLGYPVGTEPGWGRRTWNRVKAAGFSRLFLERFTTQLPPRKDATKPDEVSRYVRTPASAPVLIALLDSNPARAGLHTATGVVKDDDLVHLQLELREKKEPYVARIAIVHHHVLPIAYAAGAGGLTGEPMMVLRNAGTVLRTLADNKFDLILHGHWHKSQFARIDFGNTGGGNHSIAVVSAGSAAMTSKDNTSFNSLNLITIGGQIVVKSVDYGATKLPTPHGVEGVDYRLYGEPLAAAKQRTYVRALERHPIECDKREQSHVITENGDLWVSHRIDGLKTRGNAHYPGCPFVVHIPPHGHFVNSTLQLDDATLQAGGSLEELQAFPRPKGDDNAVSHYWLEPPGGELKPEDEWSYTIDHGCANCMKMTQWEAAERVQYGDINTALPPGYDNEWVGARVAFPTRKLVLKARFPRSLASVPPYIECRRPAQYPLYTIDGWGEAKRNPEEEFVVDPDVQREEQRSLRFDAPTSTWIAEIAQPLVGYQYSLRWRLPSEPANQATAGSARGGRDTLLGLGDRLDGGTETDNDREAIRQFKLLCTTLRIEACDNGQHEHWTVALFIYDAEKLALRPILSSRSTGSELPRNFKIPYGDGVSGAAFQQRRVIAWNSDWAKFAPEGTAYSLITPVAYPDPPGVKLDPVSVLALPVYHSGREDDGRPPPWAMIGVVTVDSSSHASPIKDMGKEKAGDLQIVVQAQIDEIITAVRGTKPPDQPTN
jgi:3',5'-cyclic AMP phosphodiesterase CpdA